MAIIAVPHHPLATVLDVLIESSMLFTEVNDFAYCCILLIWINLKCFFCFIESNGILSKSFIQFYWTEDYVVNFEISEWIKQLTIHSIGRDTF